MKIKNLFAWLILAVFSLGFLPNATWQKLQTQANSSEILSVRVVREKPLVLIVTTQDNLYRMTQRDENWEVFQSLNLARGSFQDVWISRDDPNYILAVSDLGAYESRNQGNSWAKIFKNKDDRIKCTSVSADADYIYIGTTDGLLLKFSNHNVWEKSNDIFENESIGKIAGSARFSFLTTPSSVYRVDRKTKEIRKVFTLKEKRTEAGLPVDQIQSIVVYKDMTFVATAKGVYGSKDDGENFHGIDSDGLPVNDITSLAVVSKNPDANPVSYFDDGIGVMDSSHGQEALWKEEDPFRGLKIFVGTLKGAFVYEGSKWSQIYDGLETNRINELAADSNGQVYAATDRGLFLLADTSSINNHCSKQISYDEILNYFDDEPTILEVQRMAVNYADVHPQKVKRWKRSIEKKAWLPNLSVGIDGDRNRTLSDTVYGSYSGGGQDHVGPDDKTFYDNLGWRVSLSWDFSELIWDNDQTSVDSRSKLMVELRDDLLDEITRLYFERRRLQVQVLSEECISTQNKVEQKMRLDELTALIDALTGGEFSERVDVSKNN